MSTALRILALAGMVFSGMMFMLPGTVPADRFSYFICETKPAGAAPERNSGAARLVFTRQAVENSFPYRWAACFEAYPPESGQKLVRAWMSAGKDRSSSPIIFQSDDPQSKVKFPQTSLTQPETSHSSGLQIFLESRKSTYQVGEPLVVDVKLRNNGQKKVILENNVLDINYGGISIRYRLEGKEFTYFSPIFNRDCIAGGLSFDLLPGLEITEHYWLFYQPRLKQFILNEPGKYEIQAKLRGDDSKTISSNVVKLQVVNPPPKEQEALALLSDPDLAEFAVGLDTFWATGEQIETGIEKAVNFVEKHPRSLYCPIVRTKLNQMLQYLKSSDRLLSPKLQSYFKKFLDEKGTTQSR